MYDSEATTVESEPTAFRKAEKKYKIYYDNCKRKKLPRPVDLSEVLDFKSILERYNCNAELPEGVYALKCDFDRPIFCMESRPGFYFIPGALSTEEQCQWIRESLMSFPQPPNRTNHNAIYGPIDDLFVSTIEGKVLVFKERDPDNVDSEASFTHTDVNAPKWKFVKELGESSGNEECNSVKSSVLLRKLRWSTLGLQFDWSKRSYNVALPHKKIPDALCELAKRFAAPAMPYCEEFKPEAAIVNYFGLGNLYLKHLEQLGMCFKQMSETGENGCTQNPSGGDWVSKLGASLSFVLGFGYFLGRVVGFAKLSQSQPIAIPSFKYVPDLLGT